VISLPDGTTGKVLAGLIGAVALILVHAVIVSPVLAFYSNSAARLQDRRDVARRFATAARDLPALRTEVQQWREQSGGDGLLLSGSSDAVAAANLQSKLKDLVEEGGSKLTSAQTLAVDTQGNFRRVGMRISFASDLTLLTSVLLGVETARPVLSVGNLDLRGSDNEALTVVMDVYGFRSQ
jgi:general secretion pathway protein M